MQQQKRNPTFAIALGAVCLISFAAFYFYNYTMVKERSHFPDLAVTEFQRDGIQHVHITGHIIDSALAIYGISTRRKDSSVTILVHAFLVGPTRNGVIQYDVVVPNDVNSIRFGNKEAIIWQRN